MNDYDGFIRVLLFENISTVLEDSKSEGSAEIEEEHKNDENEEAEKILIIDPDSEVRLLRLIYFNSKLPYVHKF